MDRKAFVKAMLLVAGAAPAFVGTDLMRELADDQVVVPPFPIVGERLWVNGISYMTDQTTGEVPFVMSIRVQAGESPSLEVEQHEESCMIDLHIEGRCMVRYAAPGQLQAAFLHTSQGNHVIATMVWAEA